MCFIIKFGTKRKSREKCGGKGCCRRVSFDLLIHCNYGVFLDEELKRGKMQLTQTGLDICANTHTYAFLSQLLLLTSGYRIFIFFGGSGKQPIREISLLLLSLEEKEEKQRVQEDDEILADCRSFFVFLNQSLIKLSIAYRKKNPKSLISTMIVFVKIRKV